METLYAVPFKSESSKIKIWPHTLRYFFGRARSYIAGMDAYNNGISVEACPDEEEFVHEWKDGWRNLARQDSDRIKLAS